MKFFILASTTLVVFLLGAASVSAQGMMGGMNFGIAGASWFGWFMMILWWALIIIGIVALVKWLASQSRGTPSNEKIPLEILKERYAKGEIGSKEFEEKKKILLL